MKAPIPKVAVAALLVLTACSGNSFGPTAPSTPSLPRPAAPTGGSVADTYSLEVYARSGAGIGDVQVFLDGVVVCTGGLGSYWDNYDVCNGGGLGSLAVGRHAFAFTATQEGLSQTGFHVSAHIVVNSQRIASWQEEVTLATGETWTREFVVEKP